MIGVAVGIDTGLRACGVAVANVRTGNLWRAWLVKNPVEEDDAEAWVGMAFEVKRDLVTYLLSRELAISRQAPASPEQAIFVELLAIERQAIRATKGKGGELELATRNPSQILGLASVVGALFSALPADARLAVYPQTWNGNKGKAKSNAIVWGRLTEIERARCEGVELKSTGHNVIDAAGIAKWAAARARLKPNHVASPMAAGR